MTVTSDCLKVGTTPFGYAGGKGPGPLPEDWPGDCGRGSQQSPIDLPGDLAMPGGSAPSLDYRVTPFTAVNNGATIQYCVRPGAEPDGNRLLWDGAFFDLDQFHFHVQSEHSLAGEYFPMEMHLVHRRSAEAADPPAQSRLAVVAVFLGVPGEHDGASLWSPGGALRWFEATKLQAGETRAIDEFLVGDLLGPGPDMLHYLGSLTVPPCSEGVAWFVQPQPLIIDRDAPGAFPHAPNWRPRQDRGARPVSLLKA